MWGGCRVDAAKPDELDVLLLPANDDPQAVRPFSAVGLRPLQYLVEVGLGELPFVARPGAVPEVDAVGRTVDLAGLIPWVVGDARTSQCESRRAASGPFSGNALSSRLLLPLFLDEWRLRSGHEGQVLLVHPGEVHAGDLIDSLLDGFAFPATLEVDLLQAKVASSPPDRTSDVADICPFEFGVNRDQGSRSGHRVHQLLDTVIEVDATTWS